MTERLLLDEHYAPTIAVALRERGHDVVAAAADSGLRGASDPEVFEWAAAAGRRIVTENIKDFRPLLMQALSSDSPVAAVLFVPPRRFPRGRGDRTAVIVAALHDWLSRTGSGFSSPEGWLT